MIIYFNYIATYDYITDLLHKKKKKTNAKKLDQKMTVASIL